ncbi:hypothetical protein [Microcystis aeruginosa]|uniref:hypothetical protein n=1 Tax=Microcystis aeruginosa TaxID=1126 RepID=UPI00178CA134|nr:hypothetical protein [Microcystis aeruginosa]
MPIVFNLERANQLSPLPDKDLADFCPLIEPYQVTKNHRQGWIIFAKKEIKSKKEPLATSQNYPMILSKLATARGFNGETCGHSLGQ